MIGHQSLWRSLRVLNNLRRRDHQSYGRNLSLSVATNYPIRNVRVNNVAETIEVQFQNDLKTQQYEYPWIFLQDNCTCSECFHDSSKSRRKLMTNLDLEKSIQAAKVTGDEAVEVKWCDGHCSTFSESWLMERRFTEENRFQRTSQLRDDLELIGSDFRIPVANFHEALRSNSLLLQLLKTLCRTGTFMLEGAPKEAGQLRKFVSKFGFIRTTHYGDEFTVKSERNASNLAYTSAKLCVHTDLPYYINPPSVQLLHCIKQYHADAEGGSLHLVDGFQVAAQLRQNHPEAYNVLSTVPVEFEDIGESFTKFHKIHHSPTFVHSPNGQLTRIVYSNQQLSSCLPVPIQKVKSVYQALKLFTEMCYDPRHMLKFKLQEGEIIVFDNWRFLHGREGFDPEKGERHVEGCYIDWDEIYSGIHVLQADVNNTKIHP